MSAIPTEGHLDILMGRAEVKPRRCGGWFAFIKGAAHVAYAYGENHILALESLRKIVAEEWLTILRTLKTIERKEPV